MMSAVRVRMARRPARGARASNGLWFRCFLGFLAAVACHHAGAAADTTDVYLSDAYGTLAVSCQQGWGELGLNAAAAAPGQRPASPLRIGETTFEKGLGHHATGEFTLEVEPGEFIAFAAQVGVQWQGGGRGSVTFQVYVDDILGFDSGRMTDSDPAQSAYVALEGGRSLRLVASDSGDGIGCDMANWAEARLVRDPDTMRLGKPCVTLCGVKAPEPSAEVCGFSLIANAEGPQVVSLGTKSFAVSVRGGETVVSSVPVFNIKADAEIEAEVTLQTRESATVRLGFDGGPFSETELGSDPVLLRVEARGLAKDAVLRLETSGTADEALVRWRNIRIAVGDQTHAILVLPRPPHHDICPPRVLPALRPAIEQALIEWDWRMQDGIGTERRPATYATAVGRVLDRGDALLAHLESAGVSVDDHAAAWRALHAHSDRLRTADVPDGTSEWEALWLAVHHLRRRIAFANPLADVGPLLFVKCVPAVFSHQLTQYHGRHARAGGGLFVLDAPGASMGCRPLVTDQLPDGCYMQPDVPFDAARILFAFCEVPSPPADTPPAALLDRHYHLYEVHPNGSGLRQLTDGPYDDFSPRELPNGEIVFISTRRGGFHRCGRGPCNVYTLALADADGSNPKTVSYHETHEWDPAVLADGRVIYTRWDYVDRNAVHYQQLWSVRPDGTGPAIYYGNNTFNPVGVWEAFQVPGSPLIMATAAAHHAMTAGSIILVDTTKGVDGLAPITRLTPDAPFPESETYVAPHNWHAPGSPKEYDTPEETERWPGHCYRSPHPLSETFFLAAYSFDPLIGEPDANKANMFGIYLVDAFGNKELISRDLNLSSQWPVPIRPRPRPPVVPPMRDTTLAREGTFYLEDVYASEPKLPEGSIKALRIVQVLPKTTPHANEPTVGLANASPGKQVIGTAPVEPDGSAYFRAPAGIPLAFQALDERGQAVQVMRSVTYLQPGERASCVGCHENRMTAPTQLPKPLALRRAPSAVQPGPDGSIPLSYPLLVQPVLDRHCVACHSGAKPAGPGGCPIVLTGEAEDRYTKSYNVLAKRVPFSSWGGLEDNGEPLTQPNRFGARASSLMKMLLAGHHDVRLDGEDLERLVTWMDANALFYGTFDPDDQARQLRGERIEGPALQ
ncbi:MAG TPA: NPCBM/NEW2 domain-containing protein [Candidatus Hydrogenedentes bacterium]|nr:NPCBM/NEW2 domain-containing protein [Candidatus Hydrogenedentota bacterium]